MAADTPTERFEDVDWSELGGASFTSLSKRNLGLVATLTAILAAFCYDYFLVDPNSPTFESIGWNVTRLDWLFVLTLVLLFFYVVVPLYQNKRMTRYYWRNFRRNRAAVYSLVFLLFVFVVGLVGPLFLEQPKLALLAQYQPPVGFSVGSDVPISCVGETTATRCHGSWKHPLGTTGKGKDILTLIIYGMQVSMKIGLISSLLIVAIGTTVGTVSAYVGGLVDEVLMRYVDIQQVFPTFLLYLLLIYLFGGTLFMFVVVFGLTSWGGTARLVRSAALQRNEEEYIAASKNAGANTGYVIRRHLIPNVSSTIITNVTLLIPGLILFEAALAFLSLGDPTLPSWGQVIAAGRSDLETAWWISTIPGFFLFFTILAFNFLGDALRDALDPRAES